MMHRIAMFIMISPNPCSTPNLRLLLITILAPLAAEVQKLVDLIAISIYACLLRNLTNLSKQLKQQITHFAANSDTVSRASFSWFFGQNRHTAMY